MKAYEHRSIGDDATGGALVDLAPAWSGERFALRHGDVIALSGDFFLAEPSPPSGHGPASGGGAATPSGLFELAAVPGDRGTRPGTRDEIVCALKVMAVDEGVTDERFEAGGEFAGFAFGGSGATSDVERRVRDRFIALAAANADHFVAPWGTEGASEADRRRAGRFDSAPAAYRRLHQVALEEAWRLGRVGGDLSRAMAREAAAQHYLTDAFAAGHLRTPVAALRRYWHWRYPQFWESLQRKVASDTSAALRELSRPMRLVPERVLYGRTLSAVRVRTRDYPPISLGDLLARVFHDWDNTQGLVLEDGAVLYGDGRVDEGVGAELARRAVRAGNDDVEVAFAMGSSGGSLSGEPLYAAVREATHAPDRVFLAEGRIPRLSPENPPQNWRAADVEELWEWPIVGTSGTTVGRAVAEVLAVGGEVSRRLDCLGEGVVEAFGLLPVPILRDWVNRWACQAYHRGFIEALAREPRRSVQAVVAGAGASGRELIAAPRLHVPA